MTRQQGMGASETIKILETVPIVGKDGTVNAMTCTSQREASGRGCSRHHLGASHTASEQAIDQGRSQMSA